MRMIYGSPYSSLHLSLGSWTFMRTVLYEGICILVRQLTAADLLLTRLLTTVSCLTYLTEVYLHTGLFGYLNEYIPLTYIYTLRKKGTKTITGAVSFQKVHFCTLRVHIGTLMVHTST